MIIQKHSLTGKTITHPLSDANKAINRGINETSSEIVVITSADGMFDKDTIHDLVSTLLSSDDIGAVSGDLIPVTKSVPYSPNPRLPIAQSTAKYAHGRAMSTKPTAPTIMWWHLRKLHRTSAGAPTPPAWHSRDPHETHGLIHLLPYSSSHFHSGTNLIFLSLNTCSSS